METIWALLIGLTTLPTVFCYNIDSRFTVDEMSIPRDNLEFGYTTQFLNKETLIVGAPPAHPHDRTDTGDIYSCNVNSKNCQPFAKEPVKSLAPSSSDERCFKPRYNEPCTSSSTRTDKWYYDPVFTNCKVYKPLCADDTKSPSRNIFDNEKTCVDTCKSEIQNKAKNAIKDTRTHSSNCVFYIQSADLKPITFYEKTRSGREESINTVQVGYMIEQNYACGRTFVAKYESGNQEYLYFLDEDNKFDVVLKPRYSTFKYNMMITVGSMAQIRKFIFKKTFAPLGLSLTTTSERSVACKPQWSRKYLGTIGKCYLYDENRDLVDSVIPLQNVEFGGIENYMFALSGFSAAHTSVNPELLFVGAPYGGSRQKGTVVAIHVSKREIEIFGLTVNPLYHTTNYRDAWGNMWGFSLAAGNVDDKTTQSAKSNIADVIGGGPRGGEKLDGVALLVHFATSLPGRFKFKDKLENPDAQVGSYFGAAVCMADVNSDQKDDILVGAPYHSKNDYDEGRVYVFMSKQGVGYKGVEYKFFLEGKSVRGGRFGTTIANIGDINKDGFVDIAVGAPGGGKGAVYIFNGNAQGINVKYSQVIDETNQVNIGPGFGISITGGVDVNGDTHGDIAVGSYLSEDGGKAFILKSRPVIYLKLTQTVSKTEIPPEPFYSNCVDSKNKKYHCINMKITIEYAGEGTPDSFEVRVTITMDTAKQFKKRATLLDKATNSHVTQMVKTATVRKGVVSTIEEKVEVKVGNDQENMDLFTPIFLDASYSAVDPDSGCGPINPCPILAKTEKTRSELGYKITCANRKECKPYLRLTSNLHFPVAQTTNDIIYGVTNKMVVNVTVTNTGETAYQPKLYFKYHYDDFDVQEVQIDGSIKAWEDQMKPIPLTYTISQMETKKISIKLAPKKRKPSTSMYVFELLAKAIGSENLEQLHNHNTFNTSTSIETCLKSYATIDHNLVIYYEQAKRPLNLTKLPDNRDLKFFAYDVRYTFYVKNDGGNTIDNLLADVNIVDEVKGVRFMCIEAMYIDSIPCVSAANCRDYLEDRQRRANITIGSMKQSEINVRRIQCPINSIKMRRRATITLKTMYFADTLSQLKEIESATESVTAFLGGLANLGGSHSNFTATLSLSHNDDMKPLYYQRSQCASNTRVTVKFINGGDVQYDRETVPMWIYAAAVAGALLLLLLIILCLIKLGFFKKKGDLEDDEEDEEDDDEEY